MKDEELRQALRLERYPRSNAYDPRWVVENLMGPNVLWMAEALTQVIDLRPGLKVLDLGCGKAVSSIFLAREFGVEVWATDLWIGAEANRRRIAAAGMEAHVHPVHAEAHALPYADGFFDVTVSLDAYHYFGTDDLYIGRMHRLLRPGGVLGIVVPGLSEEPHSIPPPHLAPFWQWDFRSFHSPDWWRRHWEETGLVNVTRGDMVPDGWSHWLLWLEVCRDARYPAAPNEIEMLKADGGRLLGFARVVATVD